MYRIAVPTRKEYLFKHFGQCQEFTLYDIDEDNNKILKTHIVADESHEHGFPHWLLTENIRLAIVGNIGEGAINKLKADNVDVIAGAKYKKSLDIVNDYLAGKLETTEVKCNHMGCGSGQHHH